MALVVAELAAVLDLDSKPFDRGLKRMDGNVSGFASGAAKAMLAVGAGVAAGAGAALTEWAGFERGMNEVFTLLPGMSKSAHKKMIGDVRAFSREFKVLPDQVVPALYQALSAGVPPGNVFDFLETAQKAAVGGVSDLKTSVDGLSSVVNAYGDDMIDAERASDLMFTTVRLGKTDFGQLSASLFNVIPTAASLGVKFEDVSAALATMTAQGVPTTVATTQLRQAFVELSRDGGETADLFKELSGQTFADFIASGGNTADALALLEEHAEKTGVGVADLFGSVEAGQGALALTGGSMEGFRDNLDEMAGAAGATDAAYQQMDQGIGRSFDSIRANLSVLAGEVGEMLAPAAEAFAGLLDSFLAMPDGAKTVVTAGGIAAGGIGLIGGAAILMLPKIAAAKQALETLNITAGTLRGGLGGVAKFLTGPWGIAIGASTIALGWWLNAKSQANQAAEEFATTLDTETGALTENSAAHVVNRLEQSGALELTERLGIANGLLTDAILDVGDARETLTRRLEAEAEAGTTVEGYTTRQGEAANKLLNILGEQSAMVDQGTEKWRAHSDELKGSKAAQDEAAGSADGLTASEGLMAEAADAAGVEMGELTGAMEQSKSTADSLREAFDMATGSMVAIDRAGITFRDNLATLTTKLSENGTTLDHHTEQGRDNHTAVLNVIDGITGHIQALADDGRKMDEIRPIFDRHVEDFRKTMRAAGFTEDQINDLIEQYGLTPDTVETAVAATGVDGAVSEVNRFKDAVAGVGQAYTSVAGFARMDLKVSGGRVAEGAILNFADGGLAKYKPGPESHYAQIARPGDMRVWAEPETGGEAYIPLAPSKRDRSLAIWQETGKRLGVDPWKVREFADGGITAHADFDITELTKMPDFHPAMGWKAMFDVVKARFPDVQLHSGLRPGAITATGNPSWHGKGRAIDISPRMDIFNWMKDAASWLELIFSPAGGRQEYRGRDHMFSGVTRNMHWDHIHAALANGGIAPDPLLAMLGEKGPEAVIPLDSRGARFLSDVIAQVPTITSPATPDAAAGVGGRRGSDGSALVDEIRGLRADLRNRPSTKTYFPNATFQDRADVDVALDKLELHEMRAGGGG